MQQDLILFDGQCPLCQRSMRFVQSQDHKGLFLFAPLQGDVAKQALKPSEAYLLRENTLVLLEHFGAANQRTWIRGRAVFRILWLIGGKWKLIAWLCFVPFVADFVYKIIARHRHRIVKKDRPL